jgi:hypothetical protein
MTDEREGEWQHRGCPRISLAFDRRVSGDKKNGATSGGEEKEDSSSR